MIRIYTKPKGQIPDYNEPVILHDTNPTLEQFCNRIHKVKRKPISIVLSLLFPKRCAISTPHMKERDDNGSNLL